MTKLSVNLNKIALLRNSRGRDFPSVVGFTKKYIELGVHGITVHPRQDERHITRQDARDLSKLLADYPEIEYNIEGYPSDDFLELVEECNPEQCTLVPDAEDQLTSDHGWDVAWHSELLEMVTARLKKSGIRVAAFWILMLIKFSARLERGLIELSYTQKHLRVLSAQISKMLC